MKIRYPKEIIKKLLCALFIFAPSSIYTLDQYPRVQQKKDWTFIVYMAADNDLRGFAAKNIKQMCQIGSNEHINIIVHLDIKISGNKKITRRYYVKKDKFMHMNANDPHTQSMDSGDPHTLISCCKWAIEYYPAHQYALVFWNHGSGILDTERGRILNVIDLFVFNPKTRMFDLDRSISPFELMHDRGVCWDDTTGNYLTNQKLDTALKYVCNNYLHGGKFSIIGFDACFMSMLEVCNITKKYADIMVGSQEVELGTGWNYSKILAPFQQSSMRPIELATQIVVAYHDVYHKITNDFTQSAINLTAIDIIEQDINAIASLLIHGLKNQRHSSVKNAIEKSRKKANCTHFSEPSYIDLHHWCTNMLSHINSLALYNEQRTTAFKNELEISLKATINHIEEVVFANAAGYSLRNAEGLSVYFPLHNIHSSYRKTPFAAHNAWPEFLSVYLKG